MSERFLLAGLSALAAVTAMMIASPDAHAGILSASTAPLSVLCEHRSEAHIAEHGGRHTDDAYHIARGELPSCDADSDKTSSDHNDDDQGPHIHHRDKLGPSWRDLLN